MLVWSEGLDGGGGELESANLRARSTYRVVYGAALDYVRASIFCVATQRQVTFALNVERKMLHCQCTRSYAYTVKRYN
jgi:hypothetical protein